MGHQLGNGRSLFKDLFYGGIGGIVGTLLMEQVSGFMYKFESDEKKKKEENLRTEPLPQAMARRITEDVLHLKVSDETLSKLGNFVHWGYGIAWGALYGALHQRVPVLSKAAGLPFGFGFWIVGDEIVTTAFKITPPPQAFPIDAHMRGLAGHLAFTVAADGTFRALRKLAIKTHTGN
jgi:uncharacterized membrane protein YagU involved in acid resistance